MTTKTYSPTISKEKRRCKLSEEAKGKKIYTRKMLDRRGYVVRETHDYYLVLWDGTKTERYFAKSHITFIDSMGEDIIPEPEPIVTTLPAPFSSLDTNHWEMQSVLMGIVRSKDGLFEIEKWTRETNKFNLICTSNDHSIKVVFKYWQSSYFYKFRGADLDTIIEYYNKLRSNE